MTEPSEISKAQELFVGFDRDHLVFELQELLFWCQHHQVTMTMGANMADGFLSRDSSTTIMWERPYSNIRAVVHFVRNRGLGEFHVFGGTMEYAQDVTSNQLVPAKAISFAF